MRNDLNLTARLYDNGSQTFSAASRGERVRMEELKKRLELIKRAGVKQE